MFPCLTRLFEALFCLPVSNATVVRLFSVMNVIKTKLRNGFAASMVEALLLVKTGIKRKGQDCTTFVPLPSMFKRFNKDMYCVSKTTTNSAEPSEKCQSSNMPEDDQDLNHILNDVVEELFE